MADSQTSTFAVLFAQWGELRRFEGFAPDEFPSYEACCAAERAYEERLDDCERLLLAATPTSETEVACLLEVIHTGEDLTAQGFAALGRVQTWMMSHGAAAGSRGAAPLVPWGDRAAYRGAEAPPAP
ncbi:hypothetical protein [Brevundimonas sp. SL130]|uniref:hypothetical protein n=1 Tax=Brevundimonas sp. SL130 TaxID=2995143 RepID=UPI00226CA578|nr:hypothetical protein [Brevundimonas sp. SL130]WAC59620.1 hypothetical protein OU998_15600 [Brevundimonas sp. SL130]